MMRINRRLMRIHDPWGQRHGNGTVIGMQYYVGAEEILVDHYQYLIDRTKSYESTLDRFVKSPNSIEKMRK
jgi:hypothetical protein